MGSFTALGSGKFPNREGSEPRSSPAAALPGGGFGERGGCSSRAPTIGNPAFARSVFYFTPTLSVGVLFALSWARIVTWTPAGMGVAGRLITVVPVPDRFTSTA